MLPSPSPPLIIKIPYFRQKTSASPPSNKNSQFSPKILTNSPKSPQFSERSGSFLQFTEELLLKKQQKANEALFSHQLQAFRREYEDFTHKQQDKEKFNRTNGSFYKDFFDSLSKSNDKKRERLAGLQKTLENMRKSSASRENSAKLSDFYGTLAVLQGNEELLANFLSELRKAFAQTMQKTSLNMIFSEQLESKKREIAVIVAKTQQDFEETSRIVLLLEKQKREFQGKVEETTRFSTKLAFQRASLAHDLFADREFQREIIENKAKLKTTAQNELSSLVSSHSLLRNSLEQARKALLSQQEELKRLDCELFEKTEAKVNSALLLNSLDFFDRLAWLFLYNKPEDFVDLDLCRDIEKEPELLEKDSEISIKSFAVSVKRLEKTPNLEKNEKLSVFHLASRVKLEKTQRSLLNCSVMSQFAAKRQVFTEKNKKKLGVERVERFFQRHQGDIRGLFEKLSGIFQEMLAKELSLRKHIEQLNEEKSRLFEELREIREKLGKISSQNQGNPAKTLIFEGKSQENCEKRAENTLNLLKIRENCEESLDFLRKRLRNLENTQLSWILSLKLSFCRVSAMKNAVFRVFSRISAEKLEFVEDCEVLLRKPLKLKEIRKELAGLLQESCTESAEELENCAEILENDYILRNFLEKREIFESFSRIRAVFLEKRSENRDFSVFFAFTQEIPRLSSLATQHFLEFYRENLAKFAFFLQNVKKLARKSRKTSEMLTKLDGSQDFLAENLENPENISENRPNLEEIVKNRLKSLKTRGIPLKTPLFSEFSSRSLSFSEKKSRFSQFSAVVAEPQEFSAGERREIQENRELFAKCVHYNREFSRIMSAISAENKRKKAQEFKEKRLDASFWQKKPQFPRQISRKKHFLRGKSAKTERKSAEIREKFQETRKKLGKSQKKRENPKVLATFAKKRRSFGASPEKTRENAPKAREILAEMRDFMSFLQEKAQ